MSDHAHGPLQLGERAPNVVLDAITREGKIAIDDFRGEKPVLVGLYRGLHCPFCRRHIATISKLTPALNAKGIESLTVVNTPIERARLYLRYHPMPALLAASDPRAGFTTRLWITQSADQRGRDRMAIQSYYD